MRRSASRNRFFHSLLNLLLEVLTVEQRICLNIAIMGSLLPQRMISSMGCHCLESDSSSFAKSNGRYKIFPTNNSKAYVAHHT
jgi:hypothetical protein